jgi:feruloyl-CoA synthase
LELCDALKIKWRRLPSPINGVGTSERICSFSLLKDPPSMAAGEITDKAYVNQRAVLKARSEQVERLYAREPDRDVVLV